MPCIKVPCGQAAGILAEFRRNDPGSEMSRPVSTRQWRVPKLTSGGRAPGHFMMEFLSFQRPWGTNRQMVRSAQDENVFL